MLTMRKTDGWNWRAKELAEIRRRAVRSKMTWRTRRNEAFPYRYLDGEKIVVFNTHYDMPILAGSSLNKKDAKRKSKEKDFKKTQGLLFTPVVESPHIEQLCNVKEGGNGINRNVARNKNVPAYRIRMLSKKSKDKIRGKTRAFFAVRGKESTFVTLTFISEVTDRQGVSLLNKFLTQVRKNHGDFQYLWVAERQMKSTNNIHFHIIIDRRLSIVRYNSLWLMQQYNAGLKGWSRELGRYISKEEVKLMHDQTMLWISRYRLCKNQGDDVLLFIEEKIKSVRVGRFLNPFNIKKINSVDALAGYLTKYVTKNSGLFECSTWRCSRWVSTLFTKKLVSLKLWDDAINPEINFRVNEDTGQLFEPVTVVPPHGFCLLRFILNKKYFNERLQLVDMVNRWMFDNRALTDDEKLFHLNGCGVLIQDQ